ncbi:putative dor1-like family protein [Lyophyllum shimeji]|uniref:Conserved oligomeric Golgi complex subunit 8 n=1 Tax=Lyophyllum shimeji TaxID=47721 RepID=A0A9P3USF9_LYOSH|nr:putative dor1-like family protein [Lyophyllum shimeji]
MDDVGSSYEQHLTTLALDALLAEPTALQTQAHHLTSSLTSLTHTSYPTFLALHQSTTALSASLTSLSHSLSDLISTSLPALQDATAAWNTRTADVLHERSKARLVLDQHDKLKDLLDIPIFVESCVRNGYFQEALALANHVSTMAALPGAPPILASVHAEVEAAIAQMLVVLLGTLNEPGRKLPALWKAVNFLRKMDAFGPGHDRSGHPIPGCLTPDDGERASSEELLALAFLSGRLACLTAALEPTSRDIHRLIDPVTAATSTDQEDPSTPDDAVHRLSDHDAEDVARYLKKYIDIWREGAYDILTQYSTIFLEHQHQQQPHPISPQPQAKSPSQRRTSFQIQPSLSAPTPTPAPAPSLLPLLSPHLLSHLLPLLKTTLPLLPLPLLPSLLTQLTYCATAFTRVGLDFRGLIGGLVSTAVVRAVRRGLDDVPSIFVLTLGDGGGKARQAISPGERKPSEWLVVPAHVDAPPPLPGQGQGHGHGQPAHIPPQALTAYPPLARQTNAILGVLNALRLLAPVEIMCELVDVLDGVLARAGRELLGYLRPFLLSEGEGGKVDEESVREGKVARTVGEAYFGVMVPFVRRALVEGVYGVDIGELGEVKGEGVEGLRSVVRKWDDMSGRTT